MPKPSCTDTDAAQSWALVERVQAGDAGAFDLLYRRYRQDVFTQVLHAVGHVQVAEDLTQDVFVRAWLSLGRLQWQGKDFRAWLFTVARNAVRDHFRRSATRLSTAVGDEQLCELSGPDLRRCADPVRAFEAAEVSRKVRVRLGGLTARQRRVLGLRFYGGLSVAQTAAAVGVSAGAVAATQYRALLTLGEALRWMT